MEERDWLDYLVAIGTLVTPVMLLLVGAIVWQYQRSFESNIRLEEQRRDDRREHRQWLRDQRLSAYADLTKDLLSLGRSRGDKHDDTLEGYIVASRAILLVHDEDLIAKLETFFADLANLKRLIAQKKAAEGLIAQEKEAEAKELLAELWGKVNDIVRSLRTSLAQK